MTRHLFIFLAFILLAGPAQARSDTWTADMQMDEGGEIMTAWVDGVTTDDESLPPAIRMMCFESVNLRYDMGILPDDQYPVPGDEGDFTFAAGTSSATLHMLYEDMDGAFAAYFETGDPVMALLHDGDSLTVTDDHGKYPPQTFTLKGAAGALDTLLKSCG